jgi:hypothetical protein
MAQAGGLSSQYGMVDETTFGTSPTVTRFLEFNNETLQLTKERINSSGLRVGRKVLKTTQWVVGKTNVTGDVEFEFQQQGMGLLLKHMMGSIASSQPNVGSAPTVWEHTATVGTLDGKSFTCQIGKAGVDGVQRAFTYNGCKVAKWDLSCALDGLLTLKASIDGIGESTAVALAAATYATSTFPLVWTGGVVTLPGGATANISKFDLSGDNAQAVSRYFMSGTTPGTKKEQLEEGLRPYSGSVDMEFGDLSAYNLFTNGTVGALTAFFTGPAISGAFNYALEITLPAVRFDGVTPNVPGPNILTMSSPFIALDDSSGSGGVSMKYRTTDSAP